jgi:hypothetical protein
MGPVSEGSVIGSIHRFGIELHFQENSAYDAVPHSIRFKVTPFPMYVFLSYPSIYPMRKGRSNEQFVFKQTR